MTHPSFTTRVTQRADSDAAKCKHRPYATHRELRMRREDTLKWLTGIQTVLIHTVATASLLLASQPAPAQPTNPPPAPKIDLGALVSAGKLDPILSSVLQSSASGELFQAVVTLTRYPSLTDVGSIEALG